MSVPIMAPAAFAASRIADRAAHDRLHKLRDRNLDPAYGMASRFKVEVDGLELGDWSSCQGLRVDFRPIEVKRSATRGSTWLSGDIGYQRVTLKRGVSEKGSERVVAWLDEYSWKWMDPAAKDPPGSNVTITMFGPGNELIAKWTLMAARPSSWSGPDLDANSGKIGMESLELVYECLQIEVGKRKVGMPRERDPKPIKIYEKHAKENYILLPHVPSDISFTYTSNTSSTETTASDGLKTVEQQVGGIFKCTLSDIWLLGDVQKSVDLLRRWAEKREFNKYDRAGSTYKIKEKRRLIIEWGDVFLSEQETKAGRQLKPTDMQLSSLSVKYPRFADGPRPSRARLTLSFETWQPGTAKAKNPSSGGVPGRGVRTFALGDDLAAVAFEQYGSGARWRDIAEANGIDDPRRVRPGRTLYLPSPAELSG